MPHRRYRTFAFRTQSVDHAGGTSFGSAFSSFQVSSSLQRAALLKPMRDRFVSTVDRFVKRHAIPVVDFDPAGQGRQRERAPLPLRAREGVVLLGNRPGETAVKAHKRRGLRGGVTFAFSRQSVAVKQYYFYVHDRD